MDNSALTASVINSLAWPAVAVVVAIILRRNISSALERLHSLSAFGGTATFNEALLKGQDETEIALAEIAPGEGAPVLGEQKLQLAKDYPEAAILEAYKEVESVLLELRSKMNLRSNSNLPSVVAQLVSKALISSNVRQLFDSFRQARNSFFHPGGDGRVLPAAAIEYMNQGSVLTAIFRNALKKTLDQGIAVAGR